jgi:hypothetical protein
MSQGGAGDPFGLVLVAAIALLEALQGGNPQPATRRKSGIEPPDKIKCDGIFVGRYDVTRSK